jgi:peptidoglycan/LPS O-acetylase OafA/YrhL
VTTATTGHSPAAGSTDTARTRGPQLPEGAPKRARFRDLEGYRGLVAVSIIIFHVWQYVFTGSSGNSVVSKLAGFEVVDLLFVMSAYLLTLSYARAAIDRESVQSAGNFLFRRAVRILPLYWIGVLVVWSIRNPTLPGDWIDLLEHLTFTQVFDRERIFYTLGPTWSMCLEIFFYGLLVLLGPLAVKATARIATRRARTMALALGCFGLFLVPVAWNATAFLVFHVPFDNWPVYFGPQARFGAFALGMLVAVLVAARRSEPMFTGIWTTVVRLVALVFLVAAALLNRPHSYGQVLFHDVASIGWMLLLLSTVSGNRGQRWSRALSWRPLAWVGLISYSSYMWHEPTMMLLTHLGIASREPGAIAWTLFAVTAASLAVGWLSYWVIEFPTSKLRALRTRDGKPRDYYAELTEYAAAHEAGTERPLADAARR